MDIAVKRGFAIGFVVAAGLAVLYGCQPELRNAVQALRGETPPTRLVIPVEPAPKSSPPKSSPPQAAAPTSPPAPGPSPQASAPTPAPPAPAGAPTSPPPSEPPSAVTPDARDQAAVAPQTPISPETPAAPAPAPAPDASKGGAFDIVRVEPSGEMVVAGRCAANCDAELLANGKPHDTAKADADGQWAMTPKPLPPGDYQLALRTKGPGGEARTSEQTLTVAIPKPPSKDVVVVLNDPDAPSKILQPEPQVAAAPAAPSAGSAAPDPAGAAPQASSKISPGATPDERVAVRPTGAALAIGAVEAEDGRFYAQGSGPTDARLRLYLNNAPLASATIGADERWSLRVERGLAPGSYVVRADQLDAATAQVVGRVETNFTYAPQMAVAGGPAPTQATGPAPASDRLDEPATPPAAAAERAAAPAPPADRQAAAGASSPEQAPPAGAAAAPDAAAPSALPAAPSSPDAANPVVASIDTAQVKRGDSLWRISRTTYGRGVRYTEIYQANGSQIRNPNLIYPGQVLVLPADQASAAQQARP